jgi:transcriptional regulator GlxA family with amidase domain
MVLIYLAMKAYIRLILDNNRPFVPLCSFLWETVINEQYQKPLDAVIVAVPETAGSALYGMLDVLSSAGNIWQTLSRSGSGQNPIQPRIVSTSSKPFRCGNSIPVHPDGSIGGTNHADIVILPELWLGPDEEFKGRYPALMDWIRMLYDRGSYIYSACSGAIMLAETGLLDGCEATSHWGYQDLFREQYPQVTFRPAPNLVFADEEGRIVTAGGTTSWHDLAIHIISKHCSPGEAVRIAKVYLLKWHQEGQLPYANLVRPAAHGDSVVKGCEDWLADNFSATACLKLVVQNTHIAERTLKRRFKTATGLSLIDYIQNLRVEESKRLLENTDTPIEDISYTVGYEEPGFFRRLFKRSVGLTPGQYRRMFKPVTGSIQISQGG